MEKHLTESQKAALLLASEGILVCSYGNEFFVGGTAGHHTCERNTLKSLHKLGFLQYRPGLTGRGEYRITAAGRAAL